MSKGNRRNEFTVIGWVGFLVVLIFFVGWTTIELETEQRVSEHYARQAEASIRPEDVHLACDGLAPNAVTECVIKKYEEHEKWDKDRRDLHAQEDMALWAMWMLIFTALAFIAILGTLHYTRRAADYTEGMLVEARATTAAAVRSSEVASTIGQAQIRAYLTISNVDAMISDGNFVISITYTNTGASPAKRVTLKVFYEVIPTISLPEGFDPSDQAQLGRFFGEKVMGYQSPQSMRFATDMAGDSSDHHSFSIHAPTRDRMNDIAKSGFEFRVTINVDFEDVFGVREKSSLTFMRFATPKDTWSDPKPLNRQIDWDR